MKEDILKAVLHGVSEVHLSLGDLRIRLTRRPEQLHHASGEMPRQLDRPIRLDPHALIAAERFEKVEIQRKSRIPGHQQFANLFAVSVAAIGRKAHDFAFIAIVAVSDELANHRIKAPQRMGQEYSIEHLDVSAFATRHHGGDEISRSVVAETGG